MRSLPAVLTDAMGAPVQPHWGVYFKSCLSGPGFAAALYVLPCCLCFGGCSPRAMLDMLHGLPGSFPITNCFSYMLYSNMLGVKSMLQELAALRGLPGSNCAVPALSSRLIADEAVICPCQGRVLPGPRW